MNVLWESWLGARTDATDEAIMNRFQNKGLDEYELLMKRSLQETFRVLRPNHWMVLVFMNSSEKVWLALRNAIEGIGFYIEKINIFDKQHGTFKQFVSENTAGADLMIHCRNLPEGNRQADTVTLDVANVSDFITHHIGNIPILPYLHVKRESEYDYRTLYSRYIAQAMHSGFGVVGFARFRKKAAELLGESR